METQEQQSIQDLQQIKRVIKNMSMEDFKGSYNKCINISKDDNYYIDLSPSQHSYRVNYTTKQECYDHIQMQIDMI